MYIMFLQITGGFFYFSNKLFFAASERAKSHQYKKKWRIAAWIAYLLGLSPWVTIFITEHNWIAAAVEASGIPAMLYGLINVFLREKVSPLSRWLDIFARIMIIAGLGLSLYDFGGLTSLNQVIELGIAAGFLFGTYFLAKSNSTGYIWLLAGNISAAWLMMRQGYYILMSQQILSLFLVADALISNKKRGRH